MRLPACSGYRQYVPLTGAGCRRTKLSLNETFCVHFLVRTKGLFFYYILKGEWL